MQQVNYNDKWHGFMHFDMGHLLIIIGMLGSMVWWFIAYDREFTVLKDAVANQVELRKSDQVRLDQIDKGGTQYSQRSFDHEFELAKSNSDRITKLETAMSKIPEIKFKIDGISEWITEQKHKSAGKQ